MSKVTRREFVIVGGTLAASSWLVSPALAAPQTIKIGGVYPLTGNLASTGLDNKRGVELAVEIINNKYDLNLAARHPGALPW